MKTKPPLYFDTDCLSAFLWVKNERILTQLYPGRIIVPKQVYDELSSVPPLKKQIDSLLKRNEAELLAIVADTPEAALYEQLTGIPRPEHVCLGRGEAASLALSKVHNGVVASNNLRDITPYIAEFHLQHKTTGDILVEALDAGIISKDVGDSLWNSMLRKRRQLGAKSFAEFLHRKGR